MTAAAAAGCSMTGDFTSPTSSAVSRPVTAAPQPTSTGTDTAAASPGRAASTVAWRSREPGPDLLHDHTWAGAEAYVEDYLVRLNDAWTTPQPSLLDNRASKSCGTCANFREAAAYLARKGQRHEAPMLVISDVSVTIWRPTVRITADLRQPRHHIVDKRGRKVQRIEHARAYFYVELAYRGRWWIEKVGIEAVNDDGTYLER
ncbi:hypothetical protein [Humibacillus xanthopallidus]|uniref:hypothetical protein n=1 Tax=Humibacillus xanthopallidus TaxID=412689 RepID=UPI00163AC407